MSRDHSRPWWWRPAGGMWAAPRWLAGVSGAVADRAAMDAAPSPTGRAKRVAGGGAP
jgi:cell wall assembly regulator SMI1